MAKSEDHSVFSARQRYA